MSNNKKWTRDRTRQEYVQAEEDIGIRRLAELSGNGLRTVGRWCASGNWVEERKQYRQKLASAVEEKTIDSISDRLAESRSQVAVRHFNRYKKLGDLAELLVTIKTNKITTAVRSGDQDAIAQEVARTDMTTLNFLSLICDRSCKGEAGSIGLEFDINNDALIKAAEAMGYAVVDMDYLKELEEK